jgi:hypothetical protein
MKKLFLIGLGFVLAVAVFGVAGFVYAQTQEPPEPQTVEEGEFPGHGGWGRGFRGGMMGGQMGIAPDGTLGFGLGEDSPGLLHDYLWPAVAEAFDLSDEQIEAFEIVRDTTQGIRADLSQEEIRAAMQEAMTTAIENALADDAITEEQAERWLERLEQMEGLAPGMPFRGGHGRGGNFRQGFSTGVKVGRQMMFNHEYLDAAIAEALDISVEELEELRAEDGFSWQAYAEELDLSDEEFQALQVEVFTNAVTAALEDGAITQEQADWILERLETFEATGGWFGQP